MPTPADERAGILDDWTRGMAELQRLHARKAVTSGFVRQLFTVGRLIVTRGYYATEPFRELSVRATLSSLAAAELSADAFEARARGEDERAVALETKAQMAGLLGAELHQRAIALMPTAGSA